MNFEASKVQSKFDINQILLPYPDCELKIHHTENKKKISYPWGHEMLCNSVKQGFFGFLPMTRTGQGIHVGGVVNATLHLPIMKFVCRPARGKANANGQILPAATSFP